MLAAAGMLWCGTAVGAPLASCVQPEWCTVTAAGYKSPVAAQFAVGNVSSGTKLAVTQPAARERELGGEIVEGRLARACAWSQYDYDWKPIRVTADSSCMNPTLERTRFIAAHGTAIWTACHVECFDGVATHFNRACTVGHNTWCYGRPCQEYANFFPLSPRARLVDPLRLVRDHTLNVRYLSRYRDLRSGDPVYLVHDAKVPHGHGNWVFIDGTACGLRVGPTGTYDRRGSQPGAAMARAQTQEWLLRALPNAFAVWHIADLD